MVLPAGFSLPPLPYLLALVVAVGGVGWLLRRRGPTVTETLVLAFVPWIVAGSALHAVYQIGAAPAAVRPLLGTPAVYATVAAPAGAAWLFADRRADTDGAVEVAAAGTAVLAGAVAVLLASGRPVRPAWSAASLAVAAVLAAGTWRILVRFRPGVATTGRVGGLAVFGHALDGVSTAVGVDVLGFGERTPASRVVLEFAGTLPTADLLGVGWLFVLVKLAVVAAVVSLFVGYVREEPTEGYLLLGAIAAVGLGPGTHNVLLYLVR